MKKKDFKYIIKRIIIGVGIFFCIAFIKKCDVKAEELPQINVANFGYSCPTSSNSYNAYEKDYSFSIGGYEFNLLNHNGIYDDKSYLDSFNIVFSDEQGNYIVYQANSFNPLYIDHVYTYLYDLYRLDISSSGMYFYDSSNNLTNFTTDSYLSYSQFITYTLSSSTNNSYTTFFNNYLFEDVQSAECSSANNTNIYSNNFGTNTATYSDFYNLFNSLLQNYQVVYTSIPVSFNGTLIQSSPVIPSYYSKLDMSTHEGVYFVPKNYSTIPTSTNSVGDRVIPFNFYYKGDFAEGYFPLDDYTKIVFSLNNFVSRSSFTYSDSWFPYEQNIDGTTYDYYAYMLQNNDKNTFSQYHDSIVYYDSRYFDYYFIDDYSSYNDTISIIDKNGGSAQVVVQINSSLKEKFKEGSQENNTASYIADDMLHAVNNNTLGEYLNFITIPFNFLNSISNTTCTPIQLPIPFVGGTIELPCFSSVLQQYVGGIYNVILIVINGLLVYRITMRNIDTFTDVLKADDDKIEVVDL